MRVYWRQRVPTVVFCIVICLIASGFDALPKKPAQVPGALDFPSRGFLLTADIPAGWVRPQRDDDRIATAWISEDSTAKDVRAFGRIESFIGRELPIEEEVKRLAESWKDAAPPEKIELDGRPAFKILRPNAPDKLRSTVAVLCRQGRFTYVITGGAIGDHDCTALVQAIVKGWMWQKLLPPSEFLALDPEARPCFGGRFTVNYPEAMTRKIVDDPEKSLQLGLYNLERNQTDLILTCSVVQSPNPNSFGEDQQNRDDYARQIGQKFLLDEPLVWGAARAEPQRWITKAVHSTETSKSAKVEIYFKWGLVPLTANDFILVFCVIKPSNDEELTRYDEAANAIIDSIRPAPKKTVSK